MLMSALAAGRGISLPSLSAGGAAYCAHTTGAYARIREQFRLPIGRFEEIQERFGRLAATAYLLDAARRHTCAAIDQGHHPAVVTRDHERPSDRAAARVGQRCHARFIAASRDGRASEL